MSDDLIAKRLFTDCRYQEGKRLLLEALASHTQAIKTHEAPKAHLQGGYHEAIERANFLRGNPLFYPYLGSGIGAGLLVELGDGSCKYDLISGIGVNYFGHTFQDLVSCSIDAALQDVAMQGNLQQNKDSLTLMELLVKASKMDHVFLTTSGAMANENALKIILQKKQPASRLIAFDGCFMGRSLSLSQITDKPLFREGLPTNLFVDYIPFYDYKNSQESIEQTVKVLKKHLARYPGEHAAICVELVQGERGFYPGTREFFHSVLQVAKEAHLAILIDEVQTFARTYELFAFHYFALEHFVDVVTIGKISQVCATLWKKEFTPKPSLLSQTFTAATSAISACRFTIEYLLNSHLFGPNGKIREVHRWFEEKLLELHHRYPGQFEGPYGIGAMIAFTLFQGDKAKVDNFVQRLFHNGVISFVAGTNPTRVRFLVPAPIIKIEDVHKVMEIVENTYLEVNQ